MERNYAIVGEDNVVINVAAWDGVSPWTPPENTRLIQSDFAAIGDIWVEAISDFVRPLQIMYGQPN